MGLGHGVPIQPAPAYRVPPNNGNDGKHPIAHSEESQRPRPAVPFVDSARKPSKLQRPIQP